MSDNMLNFQEELKKLNSEIGGLKENSQAKSSIGESAPKDSASQPKNMDPKKENHNENGSSKPSQQKKEPPKSSAPQFGFGVMRTTVLKDNGDLLRATNEELAARPYFKIFKPQVYGTQNYEHYKNIKAEVTGMGRYERLAIDGTIGPETHPRVDMVDVVHQVNVNILPRLKLVQSWVSNITIDSPTAHRDWLKRDDGSGTKAQKAKLNNLLRALLDLESQVTFFFHKYPALNAQKIKFLKASMLASIASSCKVPKSIIVPLFTKLRPILVNINLLWDNNSFQCIHTGQWSGQTLDDDNSDDEDVKNEGPAGRPANAVIITPEQLMGMMLAALFRPTAATPKSAKK